MFNWAGIEKGLQLGEKVVTAGNTSIEDKSPIKLSLSKPTKKNEETEDKQ